MSFINVIQPDRRLTYLTAIVICLGAFAATNKATTLKVVVVKGTTTEELSGVRVCVGAVTAPIKYGAAVTGTDGQLSPEFQIPNDVRAVTVVVSKQGYQGQSSQLSFNITGNDIRRNIRLNLIEGTGGPSCNVVTGGAPPIPQIPITISNFQINGGQSSTSDRIVNLDLTYNGIPTEYQVSESSDFTGAVWKPMQSTQITYNFDLLIRTANIGTPTRTGPITGGASAPTPAAKKYGTRTLYFRLRNPDFVSGKRSDTIELKPKLKVYSLTGNELKEMLIFAKEQGFSFDRRVVTSPDYGCLIDLDGIDFVVPGIRLTAYGQCDLGVGIKPTMLIHTNTVTVTFFGGRTLNPNWSVLQNPVFAPKDLWDKAAPDSSFKVTKKPSRSDPSFTVEFKFTRKIEAFPIYTATTVLACKGMCDKASIQLISLSLEGPEDDNWVDSNRKWKNAFRR